jgi:hypothetical protein
MKKACFLILFAVFLYSNATSQVREYQPESPVDKSHKKIKVEKNIFVAKVNGYDIVYDLYYPDNAQQDNADSVVFYAKRGRSRTMLLSEPLDENYLGEVFIKYFLNHPFIYISTGNSHGDIYGEIYSLSVPPLKMERIDELPSPFRAKEPKGYYLNKNYGIRIEENNRIFDGIIYRNDDNGDLGYTINVEYRIVKIGNHFKLKPIKQTVSKGIDN